VAETKAVGLVKEREGKELHEKHIQEKKDADSQITLARNSISAYADKLRQSAKDTRGGLLSTSTSGSGGSEGTCFDSADLMRRWENTLKKWDQLDEKLRNSLLKAQKV